MQGALVPRFNDHWKFCQKTLLLMIRLVLQRSKANHISKNSDPLQNTFLFQKVLQNSEPVIRISGGVLLQKNCRSQDFNFIKDRLCLAVPLRILKIFTTAILWTPGACYFQNNCNIFTITITITILKINYNLCLRKKTCKNYSV